MLPNLSTKVYEVVLTDKSVGSGRTSETCPKTDHLL